MITLKQGLLRPLPLLFVFLSLSVTQSWENNNEDAHSMAKDWEKMSKESEPQLADFVDAEDITDETPFRPSRTLRDGVWEDEGPIWLKELSPKPNRPPVAQAAPLFTQRLDGDINAQYRPPQPPLAVYDAPPPQSIVSCLLSVF